MMPSNGSAQKGCSKLVHWSPQANASTGVHPIAVWIEDCDEDLVLSSNRIFAAEGLAGDQGLDGSFGADGQHGGVGEDGGFADCNDLTEGGLGGFQFCGETDVSGGDGADMLCPTALGSRPSTKLSA